MESYKTVDEKIMAGYDHLKSGETIKACDIWLEAWEGVKVLIVEAGVKDIDELQKKYKWTDFLSNYVQDLESELNNAGLKNKEYFQKRIQYCGEMLELCGKSDGLIAENTRRAIADSHFELGNEQECERLYSMWLERDPNWGWGYIGWSDCYQFRKNRTKEDLEKAETIITKALNEKGLRDRLDVDERAVEIFQAIGNDQKVAELEKEIPTLSRDTFPDTFPEIIKNSPIKIEKTGRNDPCPCGSGKKYKKCCGKS